MEFSTDFVKKLNEKDRRAFEILYQKTRDMIFRYILFKVCGDIDTAEDLLSEVYCDAIYYSSSLTSPRNLISWLYRIAKSKISDFFRKSEVRKKKMNIVSLPETGYSDIADKIEDSPESSLINTEHRLLIQAALAKMPIEYQYILEKKYLEGLSVDELADKYGKSKKAAESMLFRARKHFAKEIKKMAGEAMYIIPKGGSI